MYWYELATNPQVITQQYSYAPLLEQVTVKTVTLFDDGPKLSLTLNGASLPDKAARDWKAEGYNTMHLQLDFAGLESVKLTKWSWTNQGELSIERTTNERIAVHLFSASARMEFVAHTMTIAALKYLIVWDNNY